MDWIKLPLKPHHLGVTSRALKIISEPMVCLAQTVHLSCVKISTISKRNEMSIHLCLVTLEYHRVHPKWFLSLWYVWHKPCTYLALTQTMYPNGPKRDSTDPRHLGVPSGASKTFLSLWYVWHKGFTYLALTLILSPNRPKWYSTWPMSLGVPSDVSKMVSEAMVHLAPTVHLSCVKLALSPNGLKWVFT
jgi:hypothetical protein